MWRRSREHDDPEADALLGEAQALLEGRIAARHTADHDPVSGWAWVNCLANASLNDLAELASRRLGPSGWGGAVSFLAHELLAAGRTPEGIVAVQRAVLVPLELGLLAADDSAPTSPGQLVRLIQTALDEHQRQYRSR